MSRRSGAASAAALALALGTAGLSPAAAIEIGQRGTLHTVVRGSAPIEVPVTYLGVLENAAGPGYDIHLVELDGPVGEAIGVASGMSGSPVSFDGRPLGALAYRFGALPRRAIGGVTPLSTMLDAERLPPGAAQATDPALRAIGTPVTAAGLLPTARRWLAPQLDGLGLRLVAGGGTVARADDAVAGPPRTLVPGAPVGVQLVRGDLDLSASGTVTAVDGERVLAFGHPFMGAGRSSFPMTTAEVVHTLADTAGSFRMTRLGDEVGAIVEDRLTAIVGRTDRRAPMIPFELVLEGRTADPQQYDYELARHPTLSPLLAATALFNALAADNGADTATTVHLDGELAMDGAPVLPLRIVTAGTAGADPNLAAAVQLMSVLGAVWRNAFAEPAGVRLSLRARIVPEVVAYVVEDVHFDRAGLRAGDEIELRVSLRRHRGGREQRRFRLRLPGNGATTRRLALAVGGPAEIERFVGTPLARRLESATDLASTVRVYADLPPAGRLTAVLVEPGGAIVSRGETWVELPPSAARLLATERTGPEARRAPPPAVVASTALELDGPVGGLVRATVRLDGRVEDSEEESP